MSKIIYFTAGEVATEGELEDIAAINAKAVAPYEVVVRRGDAVSNEYGAGIEDADFVAGTIPADYDDSEEFPVFDIDSEPVTIDELDTIAVKNSAASKTVNGTATIDEGVLHVDLPSTTQLVSNSDTVVVKNSAGSVSKNGTATVASGVVSGVALASTVALVTSGDTKTGVTGSGTTATITVANGVISGIALS